MAKRAADAALKEASASQQIINLPNDLSLKNLVILINAHLANLGRPGTYAEEVKKGLRAANLPEVEVPNNVNSADILHVIPPPQPTENQTTHQTERTPLQPSGEQLSVHPKARHPSISTVSTTSEQSHLQALDTAISTMDIANVAQEEEIEINFLLKNKPPPSQNRGKP